LDEKVIEVARKWYGQHGSSIPIRMKIVQRSPDAWQVSAGPTIKETIFIIDPKSLVVTKVVPGY